MSPRFRHDEVQFVVHPMTLPVADRIETALFCVDVLVKMIYGGAFTREQLAAWFAEAEAEAQRGEGFQ
jgi:hypothetical protein